MKPNQVPQWPEGTITRHGSVELDVHKSYPVAEGNNLDKLVSSEQESSTLEDALLTKEATGSELPTAQVPIWYEEIYNRGIEQL